MNTNDFWLLTLLLKNWLPKPLLKNEMLKLLILDENSTYIVHFDTWWIKPGDALCYEQHMRVEAAHGAPNLSTRCA